MKWTWLRSCYKFNMRLFIGGVERIYPARWFFADPKAEWFPHAHGCEASPWLKQFERNLEWGEVGNFKGLDRGINPGYPGVCFVGDPQWFADGQLPADAIRFPIPAPPPCCGFVEPPNPDPRCPVDPHVLCSNCPAGQAWRRYLVSASGGTGVFSAFNGDTIVTAYEECGWIFPPGAQNQPFPQFIWSMVVSPYSSHDPRPAGHLGWSNYPVASVSYTTVPDWDCLSGPIEMTVTDIIIIVGDGSPPSVILTPIETP